MARRTKGLATPKAARRRERKRKAGIQVRRKKEFTYRGMTIDKLKELTFEFEKASQKSIKNKQKLTVTSISSALNIPRETVKRKVLGLQKKQLLEIGSNKSVYLGKYYTKIFSDFATGTTLDLSKLIKRWDKKESLEKLRYLKF